MKKAFVGATIHTVDGEPIKNGTLIIKDNKILKIGVGISVKGSKVFDCTGKHITPGLIDPHSHVGLSEEGANHGWANQDVNERSESVVPYLRSLDGIYPEDMGFDDARRGGVTTMGITHGSANPIGSQICVVKSKGHVVDDMLIKKLAGVKFALGENPRRVGFENNRAPQTRMGVAYLIRKAFFEARDYEKKWEKFHDEEKQLDHDDKIFPKRPRYDIGMEILVQMLDNKFPARCHSHRADDIRTAIRLSEEFGYDLVIDHATESFKIKDIIKEKGIPVVIGPLFTSRSKRELVNRTLKTPGIMVNAGVQVSITTDHPVIPIEGLRDTLIMAIREGLPQEKALETVTLNSAKVLGLGDRIGSLTVGKDADFLIFNGDPFDVRNRVLETYIDGDMVYEYKKNG